MLIFKLTHIFYYQHINFDLYNLEFWVILMTILALLELKIPSKGITLSLDF